MLGTNYPLDPNNPIHQGILILKYYFINVDVWVANPV